MTLSEEASGNAQPKIEAVESQELQNNDHTLSSPLSQKSDVATASPIAQDAQALPQPASQGWRFWAIFVPMCVATLLAAVEATVASTALPFIVADLNSGNLYVWIMNGYLLTSTAFQPLYGQFASVWGRRWLSMFAVGIFTLGSGISGGASSTVMLIAGRVIQGIGGGGISLMTQLIISDLVSVRERGKYIGIVFAVFGAGTTAGPVIGGVIVQHTSWRWVFWINLPIGGTTLILQYFFLQVTYKKRFTFQEKLKQIDWFGNFLLVASVISILIALSWANTRYPWSSWNVLVPLLVGFAGTVSFHCFETSKFCLQPTVPSRLFTNRTCAVAMVLTFAQSMLTFWQIYFLPVYFQSTKLVSPVRSGVLLLPALTAGVPTAVISGVVLTKTGRYKPIHAVGLALMTMGSGLFTLLNPSSSLARIVLFQIVTGFGVGCVQTTLLPAAQADIPQSLVAAVTSTWGFMRSYGSVWGISVPAAIFNARFESLRGQISDAAIRAQLGYGNGYSHVSNTFIDALVPPAKQEVISVYSQSLKLVWQVALGFAGLCFLLVFLEKEVALRKTVESDFGLKEKKTNDLESGQMAEVPRKSQDDNSQDDKSPAS